MIYFAVNDNDYTCLEKWNEMPLSKAIELHTLCASMPEKLKEYFDVYSGGNAVELELFYESVTDEEQEKLFPLFYGKVIELLSNVPVDVIEKLNGSYRNIFYKKYCEPFVYGIIKDPYDYSCKDVKSIIHKGVEYFLPETKKVLGEEKPFFDRTAIEFTESADLMSFSKSLAGGKFEVAANIISILARPKDEKYNEEKCLERSKEFLSLSMDKVFDVFFCFQKHISLSQTITQSYLKEEEQKVLKHLKAVD